MINVIIIIFFFKVTSFFSFIVPGEYFKQSSVQVTICRCALVLIVTSYCHTALVHCCTLYTAVGTDRLCKLSKQLKTLSPTLRNVISSQVDIFVHLFLKNLLKN